MRYNRQSCSNEISIRRVANGWAVQMPERYATEETPDSYGKALAVGFKSMEPVLVDMLKKVHGGGEEWKDLMDKKEPVEEDELDKKLEEIAQPVIGQDLSIYVCKTFQEVLQLLATVFSEEDGE